MNDSYSELNGSRAVSDSTDALLDELDAVLFRIGRLMTSRLSDLSRQSGLSAPQFMVVKTLACEGPMRVSDIAATLGVKNPAASMLVQWLQLEGYVTREHDPEDNRVVRVSLTKKGTEQLARSEGFRLEVMRRFTADLTQEDLGDFVRILSVFADTVANDA